jgi:hypothetical protein
MLIGATMQFAGLLYKCEHLGIILEKSNFVHCAL